MSAAKDSSKIAGSADKNPDNVSTDLPDSDTFVNPANAGDDEDNPLPNKTPFMQNRELSWLTFNERVLDQGSDETVPLFDRLDFVSIFWSNLAEFFMVRVGSLTELSLIKKYIVDSKSGMTPAEQLEAIYARCHELYPVHEKVFAEVTKKLSENGVSYLTSDKLNEKQRAFCKDYFDIKVAPYLSPQVINARHPFPHLENGALYIVVRLNEEDTTKKKISSKEIKQTKAGEKQKNLGAEGVTLGLIPLPRQCTRVIDLPGDKYCFMLLEHLIEMFAADVFSMYAVKHTNIICVTRNADLDTAEGIDELDGDYREHMKRFLKKRARLAPVRLECQYPLSTVVEKFLLSRLNLQKHQVYVTSVPLDLDFTWGLKGKISEKKRAKLTVAPFDPQWPACLDPQKSLIKQVLARDVLISYPYESMDSFVALLREAASDPNVVAIRITLYRLAKQSHLAEALIAAAEAGKEVTALFELRARFDESNNIEWSQRFEEAGCHVIYGFRNFKVHSKICSITRIGPDGPQYITQLGTGNYNEKTAKLYTDLSFITSDVSIGEDAAEFFRNMGLENTSVDYDTLWVAPLQIKQNIIDAIDKQIQRARKGKECGVMFKTNSITDREIIEKIKDASQAGVPVTCLVRGISCLVPGVEGYTENVKVVSIVGRLLEHSRIYAFGPHDNMKVYLSSADLMTRNMDKRIEIAWPVKNKALRKQVVAYMDVCLADTKKLRVLLPDNSYTALRQFVPEGEKAFDSQNFLIRQAHFMEYREHELAALGGKVQVFTPRIAVLDEEEPEAQSFDFDQENSNVETNASTSQDTAQTEMPATPEAIGAQEQASEEIENDRENTEFAAEHKDSEISTEEPEAVCEPEKHNDDEPVAAEEADSTDGSTEIVVHPTASSHKKQGFFTRLIKKLFKRG